MAESPLYPPSPKEIPPGLTTVDRRYRFQVVLVLVYLGLFVLLYLTLLAGAAFFLYRAIRFLPHAHDATVWAALAVVASAILLLVLIVPFFRRSRVDRSLYLEVRPQSQPELFEFIHRLCAEVEAPLPRRVFLSPEVNAAVMSSSSLWNLVFPGRQDLLIGLGLVSALNLTEFKAVLAHEFGHFSQKGIRLGPYVYASARIMNEMIRGSTTIDYWLRRITPIAEACLQVARIDLRLAFLVLPVILVLYLLIGLMKGFAAMLRGLNRLVNLANLSLMRHMEFNADLVAVSVTGSDAPINVLVRLVAADSAQAQVMADLAAAADAGIYTRDLFYHQPHAIDFLRKASGKPGRGEPLAPSADGDPPCVFRPEETTVPRMWATHPTNYEREQNAKRQFVPGVRDERSAWSLFRDVPALREKLTRRYYQHSLERVQIPSLSEPEVAQAFIDDERANFACDARYLGAYEGRFLETGNPDELVAASSFAAWDESRLARATAELFSEEIRAAALDFQARREELATLARVAEAPEFEFHGQKYRKEDVTKLHARVREDLTASRQRLAVLDHDVFLVHYQIASRLGAETALELLDRYRFHLALQTSLAVIANLRDWLHSALVFLGQRNEIHEKEYNAVTVGANSLYPTLTDSLTVLDRLKVPPLKYVVPGRAPRDLLCAESLDKLRVNERSLAPRRLFPTLVTQIESVAKIHDRGCRLLCRSLAGILAFQEDTQARWRAQLDLRRDNHDTGAAVEAPPVPETPVVPERVHADAPAP